MNASSCQAKSCGNAQNNLRWLHDFIIVRRGSLFGGGKRVGRDKIGKHIMPKNLRLVRDRLQKVTIEQADFRDVVKKADSPKTFFYLDPTFGKAWLEKEKTTLGDFIGWLKKIEGKFILSHEDEHATEFEKAGFFVKRLLTATFRNISNGEKEEKWELLVSNFEPVEGDRGEIQKCYTPLSDSDDFEISKSSDPYLDYPDESKKLKFVIQVHARGRSLHHDIRMETEPGGTLIGWTLADTLPGAVKKPVLTLEDARKIQSGDNFKIDWKTGEFKDRKLESGVIRPTNIYAAKKGEMPHEWLGMEGVVKPLSEGGGPGATENFPGVFLVVDKGTVEYLGQKEYAHEYQFHGDLLKDRMLFRLLSMESAKSIEKAVLPASEGGEGGLTWLAIQPIDQTPMVLSAESVKKEWMPPEGISALPESYRKNIPKDLRYWQMTGKAALDARAKVAELKELNVEVAKSDVMKSSARFWLHRRFFRGPVSVRTGATNETWDLRIDDGKRTTWTFERNPTEGHTAGKVLKESSEIFRTIVEGDYKAGIPSGSFLNPTKDTPGFVDEIDSGGVSIDGDEYDFKGKVLRGKFNLKAEDPKQPEGIWTMKPMIQKFEPDQPKQAMTDGKIPKEQYDKLLGEVKQIEGALESVVAEKQDARWWLDNQGYGAMQREIKRRLGKSVDSIIALEKRAESFMLSKFCRIEKVEDTGEAVMTLGIVYEPDVVDAQGDWATAEVIQKACDDFCLHALPGGMNEMHKTDLTPEQAAACQVFTAPEDFYLEGRRIKKGTWLLKAKAFLQELKDKIRKGVIKGYSLFGGGDGIRDKATGTRQLTKMNVKSVAYVDAPANKESFLLVKRKGDGMEDDADKKLDLSKAGPGEILGNLNAKVQELVNYKNTYQAPLPTLLKSEERDVLRAVIKALTDLDGSLDAKGEPAGPPIEKAASITGQLAKELLGAAIARLQKIQADIETGTLDLKQWTNGICDGGPLGDLWRISSAVKDAAFVMAKSATGEDLKAVEKDRDTLKQVVAKLQALTDEKDAAKVKEGLVGLLAWLTKLAEGYGYPGGYDYGTAYGYPKTKRPSKSDAEISKAEDAEIRSAITQWHSKVKELCA